MRSFDLFNSHIKIFKNIAGFLILFCLFGFSAKAQNKNYEPGKITGRIIDSASGQPVEYAIIRLFTQEGNKAVNGATADNKGVFKLTNVAAGAYKMLVDFMGYNRIEKNKVVIRKENPAIDMGDIKLISKLTTLKEVTVTADKNPVENKIDKMVYNTSKDITSQSGVVADVLKKVPQVSVDIDGNVELQGNSNILFLINGKPSVLFGNNIADVLQSIPASQIESIEVITSPGARYDATGTGGIINIILKKSNVRGINGNISLSGGTRLENCSVNLNARKGKFGANVFFSGNAQLLSTTVNKMDRLSQDTSTTSRLLQNGSSDFSRNGYQSGVGFDWDLTPKDNITASLGYNYYGNRNTGSTNSQSILDDASGKQLSYINDFINTSNKFNEHSFDWDISYKKKFNRKDQELDFLINSSNGNIYFFYEQTQEDLLNDMIFNGSYGNNPGIENGTNISLNYTQPVGRDVILETGVKTELDHINSTSDVYLLNTSSGNYDFSIPQSSTVDYNRTIYAGYISATFKLFKLLDIKMGFRDEYTETKADFSNSGNFNINPYNTLVPSMVVSRTFKNNQTIKISYTHRIERPDYRDLNPFINASDPNNITAGNPNLRPEVGDKLELGYSRNFNRGATINATAFYRGNRNDIQSYTNYYPTYKIGDSTYTNVAFSTRENIGREDNYGLSLFGSVPVREKLNLRCNISCFERYIFTGFATGGNIHGFNYRTNINTSYQLSNTLIIELSGNFNSPRINAQGKMPSFTTYYFAFRKQLFNKKASIAITATNFFDKYVNQKTELTGQNFTISNIRQLPYRSFGINFTYKFGRMDFLKEKETEDNNLTNPQDNDK